MASPQPIPTPITNIDALRDAETGPQRTEPETPRRGPGRPRKDGSTSGGGTSKPTTSKAKIRDNMRLMIEGMNAAAGALPERVPFLNIKLPTIRDDELLTKPETEKLADALTAEVTASSRLTEWLTKAANASPHFILAGAVISIFLPRYMARRGAEKPPTTAAELDALIAKHPEPEWAAALEEQFGELREVPPE